MTGMEVERRSLQSHPHFWHAVLSVFDKLSQVNGVNDWQISCPALTIYCPLGSSQFSSWQADRLRPIKSQIYLSFGLISFRCGGLSSSLAIVVIQVIVILSVKICQMCVLPGCVWKRKSNWDCCFYFNYSIIYFFSPPNRFYHQLPLRTGHILQK